MTTTTADHEYENRSEAAAHSDGGRQRPSYDDVNVPVVFLVGVISMILTFVTIWFVEGIYYQWKNGLVEQVNYEVSNTLQQQTLDRQKSLLDGDADKGITSLESVLDDVVGRYQHQGAAAHPSGTGSQNAETDSEGH